jgi:hypothetical protein
MDTTVITAFYPLEKSKHSVECYHSWLKNFCAIPCLLVIYTDTSSAGLIRTARKGLESKTVIIEKSLGSFRMTSPDMMGLWQRHHAIDPEKAIHSPELYAVWAIKQECVRDTIKANPFKSTWFVWCDIGIQRHSELQKFYERFPEYCSTVCKHGRMTFLEVQDIPQSYIDDWKKRKPMKYPPPDVTLGGGCIAGDASAWNEFGVAYETLVHEFDRMGRFAGKDQILFFTILMERKTKLPFQLLRSAHFTDVPFIYWMSMPCILSGTAPAIYDNRFEIGYTVKLEGRLGNQLFEIAACYAHALRAGDSNINIVGVLHPYLQHLSSSNNLPQPPTSSWHEPHYHYAPIPADATQLIGYFQSSKYFLQYGSQIRQLLGPRTEMLTAVYQQYPSILTHHMRDTAIVVHVRRGDFQSPAFKTNYGFLDCTYYWNAVRRMRELNPGGQMLLFSDDIEWCKAQPVFRGAVFIDESDDSLALTLMTQYKYYILSNSSFSWWAAWLAGDDACVLAPDCWYNPRFIADYQDIYEESWEQIPIN